MSSNEDEYGMETDPQHRGKKRRIARACDVCRRRKSRCDGSQMEGDRCSTCIDANLECTYLEGAAKRTPARSTYIESLESRLERSEAQIKHLRAELTAAHFASSTATTTPASSTDGPSTEIDATSASLHMLRTALRSLTMPPPPPSAEDLEHLVIAKKLEHLRLGTVPEVRFMGKSSGVALVHAAIDLKADVKHRERRRASETASPASTANELSHSGSSGSPVSAVNGHVSDAEGTGAGAEREGDDEDEDWGTASGGGLAWTSRRLQYWTFKPWENTTLRTHSYTFPPLALMNELVGLYFAQVNVYLPLLHRPTFERGVREGLFLRNDPFAATVLLVCAVASRWHPDSRVGAPGGIGVGLDDRYGRAPVSLGEAYPAATSSNGAIPHPPKVKANAAAGSGLACGWAWFDQVPLVGNHMFGQATLYDLQYYCLAVQFLEGSSAPQGCWTIIGVALRLAQDLGIHRRSARIEQPSVEREQFKRAFWVLVYQDRIVSSGMGRPCAMQYDDYDIDLPIECDDEYWEHPTHPFQQPPGVPSRITFFNTLMGLNHILAFSLKILYSLQKVRAVFSVNETWEENVVAELDSALNGWRDRVPEHLRWDPHRADPVFFDQSVALQCGYHHLQILVHRPFIPMMRKSAPTALPSLAICTSAARACANVVDVQRRRKGDVPVVFNFYAVFTSGIVLLLNVWSGKRTGLAPDPTREIANVQKCMDVVKLCEDRWQHAGLLWDILAELASVGQMPLRVNQPQPLPQHQYQQPQPQSQPQGNSTATSSSFSFVSPQVQHDHETRPRARRGSRARAATATATATHHARYPSYTVKTEATGDIPLQQSSRADTRWPATYSYNHNSNAVPSHSHPPYQPVLGSFAGGVGGGPGTFGPAPMEPSAFAPAPEPETWDPPADPFAGMQMQMQMQGGEEFGVAEREREREREMMMMNMNNNNNMAMNMNMIDQETIAMWANAPVGLEVDDWGNYFNNFSELTQGQGSGQQPSHITYGREQT
ncbi:fungal-specific transcription factor domain-containing protein [Mycena amicta]|nr:fungal-specific transcription factor domain-containing protein [Mycena amicta]